MKVKLEFAPLVMAFAVLAPPAIADVWTVGTDGDVPEIQDAVDLAQDGDVLLVLPGSYDSVLIDGLGLVIMAHTPGDNVTVQGHMKVMNLDADDVFVMSGIDIIVGPSWFLPALHLRHCLGSVRIEDCELQGPTSGSADAGAYLYSCADVAFIRCHLEAKDAMDNQNGGNGVTNSGSDVSFYDCVLLGSNAGDAGLGGPGPDGGRGYDGFHYGFGALFASGCHMQGGSGGAGGQAAWQILPGDGGNGGHGLVAGGSGSANSVRLLDNTFAGGPPGAGGDGSTAPFPYPDGEPGLEVYTTPGALWTLNGRAHHLACNTPVREGQMLDLAFEGQAGHTAVLLFSPEPGSLFVPGLRGQFLLSFVPFPGFALGTLDAVTGTLDVSIPIPELGPGFDAIRVHLQSYFWNAGGMQVLGAAQTLLLLDAAY